MLWASSDNLKMTERQIRYTLGFLGILDLISFVRTFKSGTYIIYNFSIFVNSEVAPWEKALGIGIPVLNMILTLLLLVSGILLILGKKVGIIIYYFEFPLRLLFVTLTFGFILRIFGLQVDTLTHNIVLGILFTLELLRLIFSIWAHRKYYNAGQTASP